MDKGLSFAPSGLRWSALSATILARSGLQRADLSFWSAVFEKTKDSIFTSINLIY